MVKKPFTKEEIEKARKRLQRKATPKKKPRKPLSFAQRLARTVEKHQRRQEESMALFRAEQRRQRLRPDQPISLLAMVEGMKKKKKKNNPHPQRREKWLKM